MQAMRKYVLENEGQYSPSKADSSVLSHREVKILVHVVAGLNDQKIADRLCVSPNTVNTHLHNVYKKINAPNRLQAILWAVKNL